MLTGGEPTIHPDFMAIVRAFCETGMDVGICTNATVRELGVAGILQGLLCAPNSLAQKEEYVELCRLARENGRVTCRSTRWAAWGVEPSRSLSHRLVLEVGLKFVTFRQGGFTARCSAGHRAGAGPATFASAREVLRFARVARGARPGRCGALAAPPVSVQAS